MAIGECLEEATDEGKYGDTHQTGLATVLVSEWEGAQRSDNCSSLHDRNEVGGQVGLLDLAERGEAELAFRESVLMNVNAGWIDLSRTLGSQAVLIHLR